MQRLCNGGGGGGNIGGDGGGRNGGCGGNCGGGFGGGDGGGGDGGGEGCATDAPMVTAAKIEIAVLLSPPRMIRCEHPSI